MYTCNITVSEPDLEALVRVTRDGTENLSLVVAKERVLKQQQQQQQQH